MCVIRQVRQEYNIGSCCTGSLYADSCNTGDGRGLGSVKEGLRERERIDRREVLGRGCREREGRPARIVDPAWKGKEDTAEEDVILAIIDTRTEDYWPVYCG